ncbi:MAG: hypothetical protein ACE15D_11805 [Candidatus Eisenbacteria bacterium]
MAVFAPDRWPRASRRTEMFLVLLSLLLVGLPCFTTPATATSRAPGEAAGGPCGADTIVAAVVADTVHIVHDNAWKNCCLELAIRVEVEGSVVRVYESDGGEPCRCLCCFDHGYWIAGLAAGEWTIEIWDEDAGSQIGEATAVIAGGGESPHASLASQGACSGLQPARPSTWTRLRLLFR